MFTQQSSELEDFGIKLNPEQKVILHLVLKIIIIKSSLRIGRNTILF